MDKEKITCFSSAEIMLPKNTDMNKWACIACDQFTSNSEYWERLSKLVSGYKTTLDLFLPEIYLGGEEEAERIKKINSNICTYIENGFFDTLKDGYVLTVRSTPYKERRIGIIGKIDLESYEYSNKSNALIRSTEGTIEERIPPRLKIRKDAKIELPHIMVLYDDEKKEIGEKLYEKRNELKKLYDFDLNMGGGHIEGYYIEKDEKIIDNFSNLLDSERLIKKYGKEDRFLFAVGDGNHSLATAKAHWNNVKKTLTEEERENNPARYALVELVNIYDEGIYFEAIYRIVSGVDKNKFTEELKKVLGNFSYYVNGEGNTVKNEVNLPDSIRAVDKYIKDYIDKNGGKVDYIHGLNELKKLADENNGVGVVFDKMDKKDLFRFVSEKGSLPRKTFSMGEGIEKRYYLEARRIAKD